ncbi:retrovirus-related pol polyprotein from transposon TNT 1-94 [Tanacetum coccineum]
MMLKPKNLCEQYSEIAIGAQNPFYLRKAKVAQPTLYDGNEIINPDHDPINVPSSKEDLELAELARQKMHEKMNDPMCVEKRIKYIPPNYSKEKFLATFTPQTQLTPEQVFWSIDLEKRKAEELNENTPHLPVLPPATVYPPNTPVYLVPRTLPTTSQVNIGLYVITQLFWDFEKTCKKQITPTGITEGERGFEQTKRCYLTEVIPFFNLLKEHFDSVQKSLVTEVRAMKAVFENMEAEVDQNAVDKKCGEIKRRNLLIMNENLIAECLSKYVFYSATDYVLNVSRFSNMHDALTISHKRIADLESENFNLRNKIQNDDHDSMIKHFSKLEVEHFNLLLKYQNLKQRFGNKKPVTSSDAPSFDLLFVIGKLNEQIQIRGNTIRELKEKISRLTEKNSDADPTLDLKALVSQNKYLTAKLNALHDLNERFRVENAKVKQHYKELYDSIKITHTKTTNQNKSLLSKIKNLNAQLKDNSKCVTILDSKPKVLAPGRYPIDVKPIPPRLKKNREVHLHYIKHLKENVETLHEIVEEAKVKRPLDTSLASACRYTKHSQELLEYVIDTFPIDFSPRDKQNASTNSLRKKRVTFVKPLKDASTASRSKPRSNTKKDRTLPTNSALKQVEAHSRINKSNEKQKDYVDSSISYKHTVIQIVLWYLDSGCSKHITGDRSRLRNFMKKFIGIVRFENDHFGAIMGYGDYVIGDSVISRVYYVEGLGHDLFSVGKFCDSDLEVAFRKHICFVRDLDGVDLIKGSRGTNLYTIFVEDMMRSSPIFLLSKASKNKSWLWHRLLNHLNFSTLNDLARKDLVRGLSRLKFEKDHLCSACQLGKSRKATHKPKMINTIIEVLHTLHIDLCGPLRVQSINGRNTFWFVQTDNGIEFVNKALTDYYESFGITHEKTVPRTPQQNGIVERMNRTLVEAARTMLIFSKAPLFLWAEAVATACYTQNRSLIHTLHNKTPYELVHDKKPGLSFLRIFGALCYPTNDNEGLGKLKAKADIGFFVGYAPNRKGYRIYSKRTRQIMETIHITFDELTEQTAPIHSSSGPAPNLLTHGPISSGLVPNSTPTIPYVPPTNKDLELLFQPMFDEYFETPTGSHSPSSSAHKSSSVHHGVATEHSFKVNLFAATKHEPFVNVFTSDPNSEASSSGVIMITEPNQSTQPHEHLRKWTDSHRLDNIIGNPSRPVSTRIQLATDVLWCFYNSVLSKVEPKHFKLAVTEDWWFQAMQDEIHEFDRLNI